MSSYLPTNQPSPNAVVLGWGGLDTLVVSAGVSAVRPLLAIAGADVPGRTLNASQTTVEGIQNTSRVALAAIQGNYIGPLVAATTFVRHTALARRSLQLTLRRFLLSPPRHLPLQSFSLTLSPPSSRLRHEQSMLQQNPPLSCSTKLCPLNTPK